MAITLKRSTIKLQFMKILKKYFSEMNQYWNEICIKSHMIYDINYTTENDQLNLAVRVSD